MKKLFFLILMAATCVGTAASAQYASTNRYDNNWNSKYGHNDRYERGSDRYRNTRTDNSMINALQREVREDIADGIVRGTINSREAQRLLSIAEQIEIKEDRFTRNGRLTDRESNEIKGDLRELQRMIRKDKMDREIAPVDNRHKGNGYGPHGHHGH